MITFNNQRVLVLSPHFDDEIISCGGALIKHLQGQSEIKIVYLTDSSEHKILPWQKKKHQQERQQESMVALRAIGHTGQPPPVYLNERDGSLISTPELNYKLVKLIEEFDPKIIYTPWKEEAHPDHKATAHILAETLKVSKKRDQLVACYEGWTPITQPNFVCDISKEFSLKISAINCFKSQLKNVNYARTARGINSYRSIYHLGGEGYAEAFLILSAQEFISSIIFN